MRSFVLLPSLNCCYLDLYNGVAMLDAASSVRACGFHSSAYGGECSRTMFWSKPTLAWHHAAQHQVKERAAVLVNWSSP